MPEQDSVSMVHDPVDHLHSWEMAQARKGEG